MWSRQPVVLTAVSSLVLIVAMPSSAAEPSAAELVAVAPCLRSSDAKTRSIEVEGYVKRRNYVHVAFRALYRAPDQFALAICDGADGTPLLFAADNKLLMYDPVQLGVFYLEDTRTDFRLYQADKSLQLHFGWSGKKPKARLVLDIQSFFNGPSTHDEVARTGEASYRLTRTLEDGSPLICHVNLKGTPVYEKFEIIDVNDDPREPIVRINKIRVNEPLGDESFQFPNIDRLAEKGITLKAPPRDDLLKTLGASALMLRACFVRLAANQPVFRDSIQFPGLLGIDWNRVKENDKRLSPILKDLLGPMPVAP